MTMSLEPSCLRRSTCIDRDGPEPDGARRELRSADATDRYTVLQRLSPKQVRAIGCLSYGLSDELTADRVGVHRVTVTRWRLYDETFRAAFADRLGELWSHSLDHLRALLPTALSTLQWAMECGDERTKVRAALGLLGIVARGIVPTPERGRRGVAQLAGKCQGGRGVEKLQSPDR